MIRLCTVCSRELAPRETCCGDKPAPSLLVDVAMTAAKLGGAGRAENIEAAVRALTERPS